MPLGADVKPHDWQTICDAPEVAETSSRWLNPSAVDRAEQHQLIVNPLFGRLAFRLQYNSDNIGPTGPVCIVWGKFADGHWERLRNAAGDDTITITIDTVNDLYIGSMRATDSVEVFLRGASTVLCTVKTAYTASGGTLTDSIIQAQAVLQYSTP